MTMVERVARSMWAVANGTSGWTDGADLERQKPDVQFVYKRMAQEAIAAMREPTQRMGEAGDNALCSELVCECAEDRIWRAMIDAALADKGD